MYPIQETDPRKHNVIKAIGDPGLSPQPPELLNAYVYVEDANRILIGDPNIDRLLQSYQEDVTTIFDVVVHQTQTNKLKTLGV